ncbi:MAG: hypothetical protein Q4G51_04120, partial [Dermatophilus congolensis]|nr:hypothetical protein [Dermatophilus congolensis]
LIVLGQAAAWTMVQYGSVWLDPTLSAGILLLSPVTSVIVAGPLFAEWPSALQWVGVALILGCVSWQNGLIQAAARPLTGGKRAKEDVARAGVGRPMNRGVFILLGVIGILLGIAAAADNIVSSQIGWNTVFTIAQTIVVAALTVIVTQDGQAQDVRVRDGGDVAQQSDSDAHVTE